MYFLLIDVLSIATYNRSRIPAWWQRLYTPGEKRSWTCSCSSVSRCDFWPATWISCRFTGKPWAESSSWALSGTTFWAIINVRHWTTKANEHCTILITVNLAAHLLFQLIQSGRNLSFANWIPWYTNWPASKTIWIFTNCHEWRWHVTILAILMEPTQMLVTIWLVRTHSRLTQDSFKTHEWMLKLSLLIFSPSMHWSYSQCCFIVQNWWKSC